MKTISKLKFVLGITTLAALALTLSSFSTKTTLKPNVAKIYLNDVNVNITINSTTTQEEFEDIMDMLMEHNIEATFTNIKRNSDGEITGIKIKLKDLNTNSESISNTQSSSPINNITFGRKNKTLYITQGNRGFRNFAFFGNGNNNKNFNMDSIFGQSFKMMDSIQSQFFNFNNDDGNVFMFNGKSLNMDDMINNMKDFFTIEEDENGHKRIIINGDKANGMNFFFDDEEDNTNTWTSKKTQKFKFYDDPNSEKLIIIDGKEATFKKLDTLAKQDKLDSVDVLKGKTAVSIYGNKAKDGAIIATTKE